MISKNNILNRESKKPIVWDAFFNTNEHQKPIVVFCHGYKGFKDWGAWDLVAKTFSEHDFFFLKFNFSHNGGTTNNPIDFPDLEAFSENNYSKELDDLNDVLDYLCSNEFPFKDVVNTKSISLIGHSRGGGIAIIKASEDQRITQLITWASVSDYGSRFGSEADLLKWKTDGVKYALNGRTKQQMPHKYQFFEDFLQNQNRLNIQRATQQINIPFLIVHASGDTSVLFKNAEALHSWNTKSTLLKIEGSNHVFDASHPWEQERLPKNLQDVVMASITYLNR